METHKCVGVSTLFLTSVCIWILNTDFVQGYVQLQILRGIIK